MEFDIKLAKEMKQKKSFAEYKKFLKSKEWADLQKTALRTFTGTRFLQECYFCSSSKDLLLHNTAFYKKKMKETINMVPCCKFHFDKIFNTAESLGVSIRMAVKIVEEQWADSGNILASLRGQIKREKPFNPSKWHVELTGKSIEPVLWDLE